MKKLTKMTTGVLAAAVLLPMGASADGHLPTITDIVAASGGEFDDNRKDFDILLNAVLAAGLEGALADPEADLTVFAPNDKAFIRLARDLGYDGHDEAGAFGFIVNVLTVLGDGDPIPVLTNVLLYHVSAGAKSVGMVVKSGGIGTLLGASILPAKLRLLDNEPDLKDPYVILKGANIRASNGIIHTISRVLVPLDLDNTDNESLPTITEIVVASGGDFDHNGKDFDILLNAVLAAGLADALNNPNDRLTVYAPNDKAFIRTARDLGYHGRDEAGAFAFIVQALTTLGGGDPIPLLTAILLYHVTPDQLPVKDVLLSESVLTLLGATIHPDSVKRTLGDNEPALRDPRVWIRASNIRASNGFIHTINRVLIPVDLSTL